MNIETFDLGEPSIDYGKPVENEDDEVPMPDLSPPLLEAPDSPPRRRERDEPVSYEDDPEKAAEHMRLVCLLARFTTSSFATHLNALGIGQQLTPAKLRCQDVESLKELKIRTVAACLNASSSTFWGGAIFGTATLAEQVCAKTHLGEHLKLAGLAQALKADTQLASHIELLDLSSGGVSQSPWMVVAASLASTVARVHGTNKFIEMRKKQMEAKQAEDRNTHEVGESEENLGSVETEQ